MILTTQEQQHNLLVNAYHRELEVYHYQVNIDNYTAMLGGLPTDEWPQHLEAYKTTPISEIPMTISETELQTIADYQYRDQIARLLRTEKVEQAKTKKVLEAIKTQITGDYATMLAQYKATQQ